MPWFLLIGLFISRIAASILFKKVKITEPTLEQQKELFSDEWTLEKVDKPKHDFGYWILRLLGIIYLGYFILLALTKIALHLMPESVQNLGTMTYQNPAMAINTFCKVSIMMTLAFMGAYNKRVRWYCAFVILLGHLVSTISSLGFYFFEKQNIPEVHNFLMVSAVLDGIIALFCLLILVRYSKREEEFSCNKNYPDYFSTPSSILRVVFNIIGVISALQVVTVLMFRIFGAKLHFLSLSVVYGSPDPTICNTLTLYSTLSILSFLMAKREKIRDYFLGVQLLPYVMTVSVTILWLIVSTGNILISDTPRIYAAVYPYYMVNILVCFIFAVLLIGLRKMYYNVEYMISSINPSTARNIMGYFRSVFPDSPEGQSAVLKRVDEFISDVKGRKRGLLNLPFWIVEHVFGLMFGLRPPFSWMSTDEQRYFLRKYILRRPSERITSFVPAISDFAQQIGIASHAIINLANFAGIRQQFEIGYIPPDARDRLQADISAQLPPYINAAPLPKDEKDPNNFKPVNAPAKTGLIAPRVVTPINEYDLEFIDDNFDYVILGSGAGGATMAYRLACREDIDPSRILLIEQGPRLSPLQDFSDNDMAMLPKVYKDGGLQLTKRFDMIVMQGVCVGGSTVINNSVCYQIPPKVSGIWSGQYGINTAGLAAEYTLIAGELNIGPLAQTGSNQIVKGKFLNGITGYNATEPPANQLLPQDAPVNASNAMGDGFWNSGNKRMRKRSMLETYIPWAEARGVKVVSNTTAVSFEHSNGKAKYLIVRSNTGTLRKIKINKSLVVAAGAIASSHFLMRSGVTENVGQFMSANFAFPLASRFKDRLRAFDGEQISMGALDPQERAVFETHFTPPSSFAIELPFYFDKLNSLMSKYDHLVNFGMLVGSEPNGKIERKENILSGKALTWEFGPQDVAHIKYAMLTLMKIAHHSGAEEIVLPMIPGIKMALTSANITKFENLLNKYPLRMRDVFVNTAHPQGGNRMSGNANQARVVDENFRVVGFDNVYVADASIFPTGITLNPQLTIMAMSSLAAKKV